MATTMTVQCPSCDTSFPVDPAKVPETGVRTQCTICETVFRVDPPEPEPASPPAWDAEVLEPEAVQEMEPLPTIDEGPPADQVVPGLEPLEAEADGPQADSVPAGGTPDEAGAIFGDEWSLDEDEDWVLEPDEPTADLGTDLEVERLDTVEEQMRAAQEGEAVEGEETGSILSEGLDEEGFGDFMTADEVMLSESDLGMPAQEVADAAAEENGDEAESLMAPLEEAEATLEELPGSVFEEEAALMESAPSPEPTFGEPAPTPEPGPQATGFQFGRRDPHDKARRLARVLVSDMITYNPDRHTRALENDTLREDFEEEIEKSWAEYVEQVGRDMAESTDYWRDALNEILAKGRPLF